MISRVCSNERHGECPVIIISNEMGLVPCSCECHTDDGGGVREPRNPDLPLDAFYISLDVPPAPVCL